MERQKFALSHWCFVFVLAYSSSVFGWGKTGHEAIALIAEAHLSHVAQQRVRELLGNTDLLEASNWPDKIRYTDAWKHTYNYHFTQSPDGMNYLEALAQQLPEQRQKGDALRALVKSEDILRDSTIPSDKKVYALKFFLHFFGDYQQPLHTGRPEDRGGNDIRMNWFGRTSNIHSVWDTGIIQERLRPVEFAGEQEPMENSEARRYISLLPTPGQDTLADWLKGGMLKWHDESLALRTVAYLAPTIPNKEYFKQTSPVIDQLILKIGHRLAHVLNMIFERPMDLDPEGQQLRLALDQILGPKHDTMIVLEPQENKGHKLPYYLAPLEVHECHHDVE